MISLHFSNNLAQAWVGSLAVCMIVGGLSNRARAQSSDFGDAPDSYLTSSLSVGPSHVVAGPRIGSRVGTEVDASIPLDGTGDDINGDPNDEEGVTVGTLVEGVPSNVSVDVQNTAGLTNIVIFVDWDGDGSFANAAPERYEASTAVDATVNVPVTPPAGAAAANSGLPFRL